MKYGAVSTRHHGTSPPPEVPLKVFFSQVEEDRVLWYLIRPPLSGHQGWKSVAVTKAKGSTHLMWLDIKPKCQRHQLDSMICVILSKSSWHLGFMSSKTKWVDPLREDSFYGTFSMLFLVMPSSIDTRQTAFSRCPVHAKSPPPFSCDS